MDADLPPLRKVSRDDLISVESDMRFDSVIGSSRTTRAGSSASRSNVDDPERVDRPADHAPRVGGEVIPGARRARGHRQPRRAPRPAPTPRIGTATWRFPDDDGPGDRAPRAAVRQGLYTATVRRRARRRRSPLSSPRRSTLCAAGGARRSRRELLRGPARDPARGVGRAVPPLAVIDDVRTTVSRRDGRRALPQGDMPYRRARSTGHRAPARPCSAARSSPRSRGRWCTSRATTTAAASTARSTPRPSWRRVCCASRRGFAVQRRGAVVVPEPARTVSRPPRGCWCWPRPTPGEARSRADLAAEPLDACTASRIGSASSARATWRALRAVRLDAAAIAALAAETRRQSMAFLRRSSSARRCTPRPRARCPDARRRAALAAAGLGHRRAATRAFAATRATAFSVA